MTFQDEIPKIKEQIIRDFADSVKEQYGWIGNKPTKDCPHPVSNREASRDLIVKRANVVDPWNPLWRDEHYAVNTRWGGIIAPPFFPHAICVGGTGRLFLNVPSHLGVERWFAGTEWEFFREIRVNDSFKVWRSRPQLVCMSNPDEKDKIRFRIMASNIKYYNQNDNLVLIFRRYFDETLLPEPVIEKDSVKIDNDYCYTNEELEYIDGIMAKQEIQGEKIRFWEDAHPGEDLNPIAFGPITIDDLATEFTSVDTNISAKRDAMEKRDGLIRDPITNVLYPPVTLHLSDRVAQLQGSTKACITSGTSENLFGRQITNWMGNDGFIRKFHWRMLAHTHLGDTIISKGKVLKKYIKKGEHIVDISLYTESLAEGEIHHAALASVRLLSEESI